MTNPLSALAQYWRRRRWRPDPTALAAYAGLAPMVVVTGGSEGIGYELARRFALAGNEVMLVARRPGPLQEATARIAAEGGVRAVATPADVTAEDAIATIEAALARQQAYCDVLVNSAGIGLSGPFHAHAAEDVLRMIDVNIRALSRLTRHFLPAMRTRGRGGILNLASLGAYAPGPNQAAYYASKPPEKACVCAPWHLAPSTRPFTPAWGRRTPSTAPSCCRRPRATSPALGIWASRWACG
jgi:nucleoside-diphosphate-sugar epimerase